MDMGNGFGFWNTMPTRRRSSVTSTLGEKTSSPWNVNDPSTRVPSTRSLMRLRVRRNVLFPHPEGPMSAVTRPAGMAAVTWRSAWARP